MILRYGKLFFGIFLLLPLLFYSHSSSAKGRWSKFKQVDKVSEAEYRKRKSKKFKEHSRVVGEIRKAPKKFTLTFTDPVENKVILKEEFSGDFYVFETSLLRPGVYNLRIESEEYEKKDIPNLKIKAKTDCVINIFFGTKEYNARLH